MFDFQRMYHTGMIVSDVHAAVEKMSADLNLEFAVIKTFDPLPFWTPERGSHEVVVSATYSRQGPQHLELVQGTGDFYNPGAHPDSRHIGVWVDDLPAEAQCLIEAGWQVLAAGASPEEGYGILAYLKPPEGGLVVELVSTDLQPVFADWLTE